MYRSPIRRPLERRRHLRARAAAVNALNAEMSVRKYGPRRHSWGAVNADGTPASPGAHGEDRWAHLIGPTHAAESDLLAAHVGPAMHGHAWTPRRDGAVISTPSEHDVLAFWNTSAKMLRTFFIELMPMDLHEATLVDKINQRQHDSHARAQKDEILQTLEHLEAKCLHALNANNGVIERLLGKDLERYEDEFKQWLLAETCAHFMATK